MIVRAVAGHPRAARAVVLLALAVTALAIPQLSSRFLVTLGLSILIYGLLAMSLDLLAGYTGLVSLGHASFLGVGAYGIAYAMKIGLDAWPAIGFALVVSAIVAAAFGLVAIRVRELTFVILTLALGQIIWGLAFRWVTVSGGDNGLAVANRPGLGPIDLSDDATYYYFVLVVVVLCGILLRAITRSPFGLSLRGIRDNEGRMRTLGYNVDLHKYLAFVISATLGGVAGILFAFYNQYVTPSTIDFGHNVTVVQMVIVGGLGTLWGPMLGAGVIVLMQQGLSLYVPRWQTILGVLFVLVVLFARAGLWGGLMSLLRWLAAHAHAEDEPAPEVREERASG